MKKILLCLAILAGSAFADSALGKKVYDTWCITCHGEKMPGTRALAILYKGTDTPAVLHERKDLNHDLINHFVRNGKHSMPFFRKTEINDAELKALGDYLSK